MTIWPSAMALAAEAAAVSCDAKPDRNQNNRAGSATATIFLLAAFICLLPP